MTEKPIADDETAQCWRNDPHQPHMWTWRPEDGGVDCPGISAATEIVHTRPPRGSGLMPCCGRSFVETPGDRQTTNPEHVTCGGPDPLADPWLHPLNAGAVHLEPEEPIHCGPPLTGVRMDPDDGTQGEPDGLREQVAAAIGYALLPVMPRAEYRAHAASHAATAVLAVPAIQQLRDELEDVRHNLAARAFTAPDADFDTILASLDARIRNALDPGQGQPPVNPPGSTSEQLPADVLALLPVRPYLSTACETAEACETGAAIHSGERPWLHAHAEDLHHRCRLSHKFTGQPCSCRCHDQPAARDR